MPRVRQPAGVGAVGEGRVDGVIDRNPAEWDVAGGDTFREGHQIRHDVEVVDTEPLSGPPESGHHLVGDEDDAVAVADLPDSCPVPGRRNHDAGGARHRFQDQCGERRRALVRDEAIEVFQCALRLLLIGVGVERGPIQERAIEMHDATAGVVVGIAARVAGQVHRSVGAAVIRAVPRQHFVAAGVQSRHPNRMLDGVGTGVGEEHAIEIAGCPFGDQAGCLGAGRVGVLRCDRAEFRSLFGNGRNDFRMLMADIGEH